MHRQHHAKLEEQKQLDKLRQQQQQQRRTQQSTSNYYGRSYSSGLNTYESNSGSYASYDAITPYEAQYSVQHWGPIHHPPRPPCPVPGVDSHDYIDDYEAFNYANRSGYAAPSYHGQGGVLNPHFNTHQQTQQQQQAAVQVPDFLAVLDAAQAGDEAHHLLDSYSMRHLVLSRPAQLEPLSGMSLGPGVFMLRVRSTSLWGEKCILTFTLKKRSEQEQK